MDSADFGKITHILMSSNLDAIKMLKILYRIQKLNTDLDWDSGEDFKISFSEEESTKIEASKFGSFSPKKKNIGEF